MKKFCISLICLSIIVLTMVLGANANKPKEEYLRIHIRANSNEEQDQSVKYAVRDSIIDYLTPLIVECKTKKALQNTLKQHILELERVADGVLSNAGFDYKSKVKITAEEFPTRVYQDLTLSAGYYDAIIVNLGTGEGNNWWCVAYPPLCFTGEEGGSFKYKSKIAEIISEWRKTYL